MKANQKSLLRKLLNFVIAGGIIAALWPVGQTAYGRWSQRSLQTAWQQEAKQGAARTKAKKTGKKAIRPARSTPGANGRQLQANLRRASSARPAPEIDWPLTRLIIPDINVDVVVAGTADEETLRRGPAFVRGSAMPGEGNCVVAGHRNMYGSWLYRVDELWPESVIKLRTPRETYTYRVSTISKVSEADTSVLQAPPGTSPTPVFTLITCTLPHTSDRVVVTAYLETEPTT